MSRRRKPWMRDVNGILLLDKPAGASSNRALQQARRLFGAAKAGHTGSLDPLATGMLPVCFGTSTRLSHFLLGADKEYLVEARVGERTATADAEGEVLERSAVRPDRAAWEAAAAAFTGVIEQIPPMHSAVHHQGRRLYELAREGREVERQPRQVTIHALEVQVCDGDTVALRVRCSKGTYVRTLVEDMAAHCGALAHIVALRRSFVQPFASREMHTMERIEAAAEEGHTALDALLLPPEAALDDWPRVQLDAARTFYLSRGEAVRVADAPGEGWLAVFGPDEKLLALAEIDDHGMVAPRRMMALK